MTKFRLREGDCLEVMKSIPDNSFHSCVTDPPYGLKFMGKEWDHGIPGKIFWEEILRVSKPGAHLLAFGGSRTHHRLMVAIEDAGWEIRDCLMWLYGSGFPKGNNHLKPAWEPIIMALKPLIGSVEENILAYGSGGINIDACRIGIEERSFISKGIKPGQNNMVGSGWEGNNGIKTVEGRWPANLILDEEAGKILDEQSGERPTGSIQAGIYKHTESDSVARGHFNGWDNRGHKGDTGGASRFFYCSKASKSDRGEYNNHPTLKPFDLMCYLCRLVTSPNGIVFDPFMGSASTGKAALNEGFRFYGIEKEKDYFEIASRRIEDTAQKLGL